MFNARIIFNVVTHKIEVITDDTFSSLVGNYKYDFVDLSESDINNLIDYRNRIKQLQKDLFNSKEKLGL